MQFNRSYRTVRQAPLTLCVLSALYLIFSVGVVKATHMCMGVEASVAWFIEEPEQCACAAMEGEDPCCDDVRQLFKIDGFQKSLPVFQMPVPELILMRATYALIVSDRNNAGADHAAFLDATDPPSVARFCLHCSFVFYDEELTARASE